MISFPVKSENYEKSKDEVSVWEQMALVADLQAFWSDNSVSSTVTFRPEEKADLIQALREYETKIKSVSFLPLSDHGYEQAPYIKITEEEYLDLLAKTEPLDVEDGHEIEDRFCDGDKCEMPTQ